MNRLEQIPRYFYIIALLIFLYLFFGFCSIDDIRHTVTSSYAILNGHFRDFYAFNKTIPSIAGNDYEIPVYLLFALWNIPVKLAGLAIPEIFPIYVMLYNKLLISILYLLCAYFVYKISNLFFLDRRTSLFTAAVFVLSPIALYSPLIYTQYDSIYVLLMLIGVFYFLKNEKKRDVFIGALFFGLSILFKPLALIGFIPIVLYNYKNLYRIAIFFGIVILPSILTKLLLPGASGDRFFSRLFESSIIVSSWGVFKISIFSVLYIMLCIFCYVRETEAIDVNRKYYSIYLLYVSYAVFFVFVWWHPMWLLIMMPFCVITAMAHIQKSRLLIVEMLITVGFATVTLASWGAEVAGDLVKSNVLSFLGPIQNGGKVVA